jgi:hypothetical protein
MDTKPMFSVCPVCGGKLEATRLECADCEIAIEGRFSTGRLGSLPAETQDFIETFIKCRGNIKEVERELGISYPTVRARLDAAIRALGYEVEPDEKSRAVSLVIGRLKDGTLTVDSALEELSKQHKEE